ncbi:MAG: 3-oxoacyl-[acyl-carrier-protein] reductase [Glaciihabitans sp.]|nr:3-oxoacyl-[acyl-carrier-protein] reductase [Glaciihabitans sp.]
MGRLDGKVAIITGAARGMGESHAKRFIKEGAKVTLTDVNEEAGRALADSLGENARFSVQDVTVLADWTRVVRETEEAFGPVTILVNNAGILGPMTTTVDLDEDDYQKVMSINADSQFLGMKSVLPSMLTAGIGSIVNISSLAGLRANYGFPSLAYVASKFATRGMTKAVAAEYGANNIRANSVHPGFINTPMMVEATDEGGGDALKEIFLGRLAEADEVSSLVLFLASDESSYITGAEHKIDAGMSAH